MAEELNAPFVTKLRQGFQKFLGTIPTSDEPIPKRSSEFRDEIPGDRAGMYGRLASLMYFDLISQSQSRHDKYDKFDFLDKNLAEASAALNIYADNTVSGGIGGEENYMVAIGDTPDRDRIEEVVSFNERMSGIKDYVWDIARDSIKFGDNFQEVVISEARDGTLYVDKLKRLPEKTIFADVDSRGVFKDVKFPYVQKDTYSSKKGIPFDWWRLIHFKVGQSGVYGVENSLFDNASQRIGRQLLWVDESLVMARLSRAWMRYAYFIDTTGMSPDQKWTHIDNFMNRMRRKQVIDRSTGRISNIEKLPMPDEDIFIPTERDLKQDLKVISGDLNIANIHDVEYLQGKFLMCVSVPKAYMAIEEGTRSKATLSQIDVQFARQVRRKQAAIKPGLRKLYQLIFTLNGIDHTQFKWDIVFPELATVDETIKWEVHKLKAEVAKIMSVDVGAVNNDWIYYELLGWTEKEVEKYGIKPPAGAAFGFGDDYVQLPRETANLLRRDPYVRQIYNDLQDVIDWRTSREERLSQMKLVGEDRSKPLSQQRGVDE